MFSNSLKLQTPAASTSIFGGQPGTSGNTSGNTFGNSIFGSSLQGNNQQQQQQQQQQQNAPQAQQVTPAYGQSTKQQMGSSIWQPGSHIPHESKTVPERLIQVYERWDPASSTCAFRTYLYNKVDEHQVPLFRPGPGEDDREWEEALQQKPAANTIPVLCAGFGAMGERLKLQRRVMVEFNAKLHAINSSLDAITSRHELEHTSRMLEARRSHDVLTRRCLALAGRVQVLRNRGYAPSADEDALRQRLQALHKRLRDPAVSARMEELWSRLIVVRGYADHLREETTKASLQETEGLGEEGEAKAKKILEDYAKQLQHLRKEVQQIGEDFAEWQREHGPTQR